MVNYLFKHNYNVIVASNLLDKAEELVKDNLNGKAIYFDISKDENKLGELLQDVDLVVSILPYIFHVKVAKAYIKYKKNMVTTSYVSNEMKSLDQEAKQAGIIILNEMGADPGIDHMSAMRIIDAVKRKGGKISKFKSYCGGLPAPEANTNPFGYKFSWSPRGVVLSGKDPALYLDNGQKISIPEGMLFKKSNLDKLTVEEDDLGEFEVYANRDSLKYIDLYGIPETKTMFRGTLRNVGWCDTWDKISALGFLELGDRSDLKGLTYKQALSKLINTEGKNIKREVADKLKISTDHPVMQRMNWLNLFSDQLIPDSIEKITPLDILTEKLEQSLQYEDGERDMLILIHDFLVEYPNGGKEKISSTMIDYGDPNGDSSMSRTVSLPAAIASRLILTETIKIKGVVIPTSPEIYIPVLEELETYGIVCKEETTSL